MTQLLKTYKFLSFGGGGLTLVSSFLDNLNKEEVFYKMKKYFIGIIWKDETTPLLHLKDYTTYKDEYIDVPNNFNIELINKKICLGTINPYTKIGRAHV